MAETDMHHGKIKYVKKIIFYRFAYGYASKIKHS